MKKIALLLSLCTGFAGNAQSAAEILDKTIAYHDPKGEWKQLMAIFNFREIRPQGDDRLTILELTNGMNKHVITRPDREAYRVTGTSVEVLEGDGTRDRGLLLRNYYVYLWGLPMKLRDPQTPLSKQVTTKIIKGVKCYVLTVKYRKETWNYFISENNYKMVAYKFLKNDGSDKGEVIYLKDEVRVRSMRIPKERSWHELPGEKYLGKDILETAQIR